MENDERPLIIIRRGGYQPEPLKGGVWKIAHADFMTAMMALFLVLWLVNSTNKETRRTVAQYFNPIQLSDTTSDRKGVRNPQDAEPGKSDESSLFDGDHPPGKTKAGTERKPSANLKDSKHEKAAFEDPYAVLADAGAARSQPGPDKAAGLAVGAAGRPGMDGGDAMRDPFDPNFWRQTPQTEKPVKQEAWAGDAAPVQPSAKAPVATGTPPAPRTEAAKAQAAAGEQPKDTAKEAPPPAPALMAAAQPPVALPMSPRGTPSPDAIATLKAGQTAMPASDPVAKAIASAIADTKADKPGAAAPGIEVRQTDEGVLISLTDNVNFGMFAIGSADPQPETIETMKRVAGVLSKREGAIIIRGHTDARPFRDARQNNWRLSTARAHVAQDLLVQGGVPEQRIEHVEGYASRKPRSNDANAAENRRIEILVREKKV
ncbi:MotB family protein [Bosea sp. BH3]|uniref:MotB family protein n=1 Tax=Bosea sp. BH3 TaxID=2871701 RepID=UPI0021CB7048|nr:MotB family protein [Bosea sp. BH3]MCU4179551.1 MotB family protein [Bosea sp. BH3]